MDSEREAAQQHQQQHDDQVNTLINTFREITSSSQEEAFFFLESHSYDLDAAVSTFLDNINVNADPIIPLPSPVKSPSVDGESRSSSPEADEEYTAAQSLPSRSRSPYRLRNSVVAGDDDGDKVVGVSSSAGRNKGKKKKKEVVSAPGRSGGIRTLADLNRRPVKDDSDSDDSDEPQEYYTGGQKSGMLVQDPSKGYDVDALFSQARRAGAADATPDALQPSQASRTFSGTGRLLTGETVSAAPQQPQAINHSLVFWTNGFTVDDGPLRRFEDPANASFMESIGKSECPQELEPADRRTPVNVNLTRRGEKYTEPKRAYVPFHGAGRTLGSSSGTTTTTISPGLELPVPPSTVNFAPSVPSAGLVVDDNLPSASVQIRLADGSRSVQRFNHHHTVNDVRAYIDSLRPNGERNYQLQMMGFPPKQLTDPSLTIKEAGLANAVVIQRF